MLGNQLEQYIKTLLGGERSVESSIRIVGFLEGAKDADLPVLPGHISL